MNPYLYKTPNLRLATIASPIAVIFGRYAYDEGKFAFEEEDLLIIDKFEDFLNAARKWSKVVKSGKYDFSPETIQAMNAYKTLALFSNEPNTKNMSKVESLINELSDVLTNVKNKKVKDIGKLVPYINLFQRFSDRVKIHNYRPDGHGFCDCDD
ncbi:MAG TPA: hypothetical protein ENG87_04175 [Candidatus Pacearchaeota archaeon]|nr:hypothetical protein BMS3Abin17_00307 [archaeon BMS3Abin17]HDK42551.1 hypothetical protein [Candidatus Pacearchaeota archaeon]HDZ60825.1 hypothetical protein [Candidatus Pacearchaeota archaeon]